MKVIGAIVVIVTAYILGISRRGNMLLAEHILSETVQLFRELRSAVLSSANSLPGQLAICSQKESYANLTFLAAGLERQGKGMPLDIALVESLDDWEHAGKMGRDELAIIRGIFSGMGGESAKRESAKLEFAAGQLEDALTARRDLNAKRKGYYETLYTMIGAAVAIVLL